jgi:molybdate transport system regulatory protein
MVLVVRLSARNQLTGRISAIDLGAVMATVNIELDGGQEVVATITRDSVVALGLDVGDSVTAVIKSTEVMVGKE